MKKYRVYPERGDLVVVKITEVNPHSVFVKLIEYEQDGLIHISEVSRRWVRNIRKQVRVGEVKVAYVLGVDGRSVNLSLKRVNEGQKKLTLEEWNKEKKAEKFLEKLSKEMQIPMDELYENVAFPFQKEFGTTFDGFETALKEPEKINSLLDKKYSQKVINIANQLITLKEVKLESKAIIRIPTPAGITKLKEILTSEEKVKISYISAPRYKIEVFAPEYKSGKEIMKTKINELKEKIEAVGGSFSIEE